MSPETMKKALAVALKISAVPLALSCSATPTRVENNVGEPAAGETQTASVADDPAPVAAEASADSGEDCNRVVQEAVVAKLGADKARDWFPQARERVDDPAAVACCKALTEGEADRTLEFRDMGCCHVAVPARLFCTPWGPPMPPAMAGRPELPRRLVVLA